MNYILADLYKINYWNCAPKFQLGYIRHNYIKIINKLSGNKLIKVIVGQRRSGKSYIIKQLIYQFIEEKKVNSKNIFYLDKEMFEFSDIISDKELFEVINHYKKEVKPKGKIYIFIDEIQNIINWEKVISSLAQHPIDEHEIFITGSNSSLLSGELATLIAGRYVVVEIFPFLYDEYLHYFELDNSIGNFKSYLLSSGLPETYNLRDNEAKKFYFKTLKDTILLKDIMHRHKIRDYILLEDIYLFLIHNIGNLSSIPSIIKYFKSKSRKTDYTTISQYISYMKDAFLVHEVDRFVIKRKEVLSGEKKYYINDLGFRNYLFPNAIGDISSLLENIVYTHLRANNYDVKIGYYNKLEVDFIAEKNDVKLYIQVSYLLASEDTIRREMESLLKIEDNYPKYIISLDEILLNNRDGIQFKNIFDFIYDLN